jgi:hypothetical protein
MAAMGVSSGDRHSPDGGGAMSVNTEFIGSGAKKDSRCPRDNPSGRAFGLPIAPVFDIGPSVLTMSDLIIS